MEKTATMDMQKMMREYQKMAAPGEPHKMLAKLAGSWKVKAKSWMEPDSPPVEAEGTAERKMLLGGRYLQEEYSQEMMGTTFSGMAITGYDNQEKKYVMSWIDTMSTGIFLFKGVMEGKTLRFENSYDDPLRGPMKFLVSLKMMDENNQLQELRMIDKNGKEDKTELMYTRK